MVDIRTIEEQLKEIGCNFRFFGRPEIKELAKILLPDERIIQCTNGYYDAGIALLCLTDHRILLIDKKPMFLTIEDVRFDMISEIDFSHRLFNATLRIHSTNTSLFFTSWNRTRLRKLANNLQHYVAKIRRQQDQVAHNLMQAQFTEPHTAPTSDDSISPVNSMQQQDSARYTTTTVAPITQSDTPIIDGRPYIEREFSMAQIALEGAGNGHDGYIKRLQGLPSLHPLTNNPYTKLPTLNRRRKFPKFY